jgi:hypothetical protein
MADPVSFSEFNPIGGFKLASMGTFGTIMLIVVIAVLLIGFVGVFLYMFFTRKSYYIKIHVFRKVAGVPVRVAIYSAKEVSFGYAGDKLWRVAPAGFWKLKVVKWLPVGKLQSSAFEYWYFIRKDGEWINYIQDDLDEVSEKMGVKFVQEDMRLQRLATERLLEQRHMEKTFWDKWKDTIISVVLFLVIAVSVVIIFYQFGKILEQINPMVTSMINSNEITMKVCRLNETFGQLTTSGVIPA